MSINDTRSIGISSTLTNATNTNATITANPAWTFNPYIYNANIPLAITGSVIFGLVTLALIFQMTRYRTSLALVLLIGFLAETTGYTLRAASVNNLSSLVLYVLQYLFLLLAPSFLAAGCYMIFGRIVWFITPKDYLNFGGLWFWPRAITPFFVTFDIIAFIVQLFGAGKITNAYNSNMDEADVRNAVYLGRTILAAGLIMQVVCFGLFAIIGIRFYIISRDWKECGEYASKLNRWRKVNLAVNLSATLILCRGIYRLIEYAGSTAQVTYILTKEWSFWVFDTLPILLSMMLLTIFFIGAHIPPHFCGLSLNKQVLISAKEEEEYSGMTPGRISPPRNSLNSMGKPHGYGGMNLPGRV